MSDRRTAAASTRCTALCKAGQPCRAWAVTGSHPPRCKSHGGKKRLLGALTKSGMLPGFDVPPSGEESAAPVRPTLTGAGGRLEGIDDAIERLAESLTQLADFMAVHMEELTVDDVARLTAVYGLNLSRYARMVRDKERLEEGVDGGLDLAAEEALRQAGDLLGVDLLPDGSRTGRTEGDA